MPPAASPPRSATASFACWKSPWRWPGSHACCCWTSRWPAWAEESQRLASLLRELARDHAVLLIERDMKGVLAVADIITVMLDGRVLERGSPARIRESAAVRAAWPGHDA